MILENDVLNFMPQRVYDQRAVRHTHTHTQPVCSHDSSLHLSESVSQSLTQSISQSVSQSVGQSIDQSARLSVNQPVSMSIS